jgi:hypothetical protein
MGEAAAPLFLLADSAKEVSNIGLTILTPGCPAVGASEELRGRLVGTPRLDQPIKGFVVVALWTFGLRLWKGTYLLFFPTQNYDILSLVREPTNYLVRPVTRITTLRARHEDLLFHF